MSEKQNLKVIYDGPPDFEMEKSLVKVLLKFGFENWACGYGLRIRDLAFERPRQSVASGKKGRKL